MIEVTKSPEGQSSLEWAVAASPIQGETSSGDSYLVKAVDDRILVAVVDGLGHGAAAQEAAGLAISSLEEQAHNSIISLVTRCHEALRKTRGVVLTLASLNTTDNAMAWIGVGNVEAVLLRADPRAKPASESVFLRGGVVGYQLPQLQGSVVPIRVGDLLILATDGIKSDFLDSVIKTDPVEKIARRISARHGKSSDDALVLVARYCGPTNGKR